MITPNRATVEDNRPLISDLLEKYSNEIKEVREKVQKNEFYLAKLYDEIWILRFVLSHKGNVDKAAKAAKDTMKFRHKHQLNEIDDICAKVFGPENVEGPQAAAYPIYKAAHFCMEKNSMMMCLPDENRGVVVYFIAKGINMSKIVENFTDDELFLMHMYQKEAVQHINDEITRRTGRLTKMMRIIDMTNCSFYDIKYTYLRKESASNKRLEDFYPQSMGAFFMVNPPSWVSRAYNMFKPLLTKRTNEKFSIISPLDNPKDARRFIKYISLENLPGRYGGQNEVWPPLYNNNQKKN